MTAIALTDLAAVTGGYDFKETGRAMLGGAAAGVASGVVGGALTGGPPGALVGAGVGLASGAVGSGVFDAGMQLKWW
jgi:hypothetical protein